LVYIPTDDRSRQLMQAGSSGQMVGGPSFCEEFELMAFASQRDLRVLRLGAGDVQQGFLIVDDPGGVTSDGAVWELVAVQASIALALVGEREQSHRGAMKDPDSSAYTFAYFVDVAGREIDKAARHGRRFALATVSLNIPQGDGAKLDVELTDRLLAAVRDTDVVARIDEAEFYVLLPETGGMGAHACRRRVMQHLGQDRQNAREAAMGLATFPHDGRDLSQLLRVAK
jgi:GGDEF domain-containing protein